jgi:cysteine desulfurase
MNRTSKIYLDYAATTPVDERVLEAMLPYFRQDFGNPSSLHTFGQRAEAALEDARERVAAVFNCQPSEIIFTSCGSESDNLALRGAAFAARKRGVQGGHILISPVEHHAVTHTAIQLEREFGFELEYLPVDESGCVQPEDVAAAIRDDTVIVSVIYANNEIGTVNPVREISMVCQKNSVPFHTDAVQAGAYLTLEAEQLGADLVAIGSHKFYGPKGVGALYVKKGTHLLPALTGGGQESGLRAGTHNIPYIVGLATALELAQAERESHSARLCSLRDHLIGHVLEEIPDSRLTGSPADRLPNHASFVFSGVDGNALLMLLDNAGFACSSGSACKTGDPEPSDVLTALGLTRDWALGSLRVTLGKETTAEEVTAFLETLPEAVKKARRFG